jgi:hypothetical protein
VEGSEDCGSHVRTVAYRWHDNSLNPSNPKGDLFSIQICQA